MMKIEYITSNLQKFQEAQHVLSDWELEQVNIDLTEIQGDRFKIVQAKAKEALRILNRPIVVEDVSLACDAIGGLPGPYIKDVLQKIGEGGLYDLIHRYDIHTAQCSCVVGYVKPGIEPLLFEGILEGTIVAPRGKLHHGAVSFNPIFLPKGSNRTLGEMSLLEHSQCSMRFLALTKLKHFLTS